MQPVLTTTEMRAVDERAAATTSLDELVSRAGTAVARSALDLIGGAYGRRVAVIAGKGNNGADGRVAAGLLARRGARVRVVAPGEAASLGTAGPPLDLVVDAAFGTGFRGSYEAPDVAPGVPVLAVDIPSGVEGDTGAVDGRALAATRTVTFVALKPGHVQGDGARLAGELVVADIGLAPGEPAVAVVEDGDVTTLVPRRDPAGNKWSAAVLVVAGSPGMTGAAALCARAAYRAGAGMVLLGVPGADLSALPASEAVGVALPATGWAAAALEVAGRCRAVVVGPGLGRAPGTGEEVRRLLAGSGVPVLVDADGLAVLGDLGASGPLRSGGPVVLTPHDGEYRSLLGAPPGPDRIAAARRLATVGGVTALLKGPTTAVAVPDGRVLLGCTGTTALATAGTGDVLSGVIGALLARGVAAQEAAALGAHVHGRAGALGPGAATLASDLPALVARVLAGPPPTAPGDGRG